jgi:hypothetical protein
MPTKCVGGAYKIIGIPMGANCASLLADLFLHNYQGLLKNKDRKLFQTFNSSFRYIDDVLSLNNSRKCQLI